MGLIKAGVVVLDSAEPEKLAAFYKELLDAEETEVTANRIEIREPGGFRMAFRRDVNAVPPSWPRPENSLQAHLDFRVDDLDAAERRIVTLGGRTIEAKESVGAYEYEERGFADPAGHSFSVHMVPPASPKQG
ncbi:VOC family protein [Streptomyces sp. CRN 30]|uniref:VOC family protein n=1 Tax=Streptomyces sp. CRN 30 TaxID=3075613 RepID=UPI002A80D5D8|nr:VOC family protein [Streptomyces sp. CRN 30]